MLAGVGMNLLTAFLILTFLAMIGMPKLIANQYTVPNDTKITRNEVLTGYVEPDSPADKAGLLVRDRILDIVGSKTATEITSAEILSKTTKQFAGQQVVIKINRQGNLVDLIAKLRTTAEVEKSQSTNNPKGYLGVSPTEFTIRRSTWSSPIVAVGVLKQFTTETFRGLGNAVMNVFRGNGSEASKQVSGPVGIFVILKDGSLLGLRFILMIIAVISLTLAIMNILPIPALDGGRLFVTLFYRALHKPLSQKTEERIHGTGFIVLMGLFVLITVIDVKRFF
jgi:regulator of sigma E protease